ncbi:MAG: hypothetical protein QOH10_514 [Actinomycetota bacterium]|jgi:hypothetical protein|nr:hypothetical protein [Actinomycetota bacterium]
MSTGERRRLIVLSGIAGFFVLVLVSKLVLFGGGGGSHATQSTLPLPSVAAGGVTTTTAPSSRSTRTPATFDVFATKNPFEPVIIVTPPQTTPTGPTLPTFSSTPTTRGGTGGPTTTTVPSNEPAPGTSVALLDVFQQADGTPMAKVQVSNTVYTVGVGDVFATSYRVVSLNAPCGQFLFADAPFKLCEGEEVIK